MHVQRIRLKDVRQFQDATFDFKSGFNLLIGENGAGKTTLLRSLLVVLGSPRQSGKRSGLYERDIRLGSRTLRIEVEVQGEGFEQRHLGYDRSFGKRAKRQGSGSDITVLYYGSTEAGTANLKSRRVQRYSDEPARTEKSGEDFLFQGGQRPIGDAPPEERFGSCDEIRQFVKDVLSKISPEFTEFYWRFEPYKCSVESGERKSESPVMAAKELEGAVMRFLQENPGNLRGIDQRKITLGPQGNIIGDSDSRPITPSFIELLETFDSSVDTSMLSNLKVEVGLTPRIVIKASAGDLLLNQLSDGQQRIFSLMVDIARVLSLFGGGSIKNAPGIVLIDEIDVHLHPRWQRIVVPALEDLFPACQFIASTHSPFVIQSVDNSRIICPDREGSNEFDERVASIEDIIEEIQGIEMPQRGRRSEELSDAAERYFSLLRKKSVPERELKAAERAYRIASEPFASNPALNALLRVEKIESEKL